MRSILIFILQIWAKKLGFECLDGSTEIQCKVNQVMLTTHVEGEVHVTCLHKNKLFYNKLLNNQDTGFN